MPHNEDKRPLNKKSKTEPGTNNDNQIKGAKCTIFNQ